ncbi:MAG: serralysin, partial [Actinomycetota bacterium]|nr:serralysin [Actinomycetota bacterium]
RPEGADDHINLKGLVADDAGRVFGAVKTSLNGAQDPLIHLLVLRNNGSWTSHVFGTVSEQHTRAVVMLNPAARRLYMFASAPCCSGGVIYYKETSIDAISFSPGLGTPFISNTVNANLNNPTSTKQAVNQSSGLVVLAGDDRTHTYMHNVLGLPAAAPAPTVTSTSPANGATAVPVGAAVTATFSKAMTATSITTSTVTLASSATPANRVSATVSYDAASQSALLRPSAALAPGTAYTATVAGGTAGVRDTSGLTMTADRTWSFTTASATQPGTVVFSDDFASGNLSNWSVVKTGADGTTAVVAGRAELASTRTAGAFAYARKDLATGLGDSVLSFDGVTVAQGSSGATVTLAKLYSPTGTRFLTLSRVNGSGLLRVDLGGVVTTTTRAVPLGTQVQVAVHVVAGATPQVVVELDGVPVFTSTAAAVPANGLGRVLIGTDNLAQAFRQTYDNVRIARP